MATAGNLACGISPVPVITLHNMASSSTAPTFTIVNLQDLNAFTEAAFTANYLHNLTNIFNFAPEDVPTVLTNKALNTLEGLRKDLLAMVASTTSTDLSTKTALTRKNKEEVINDILLLSEYLVKPEHSIDLSIIYSPSVSDANIIDVVNKLLIEMNALKSENRVLRDRVAALETKQSTTPQDTPKITVSSDGDLDKNDKNDINSVIIIDEDDEDQKELDALDNYVPPPYWPHDPVVAAPRPVVAAPRPVVAAPRPVVAAPRPVMTEKVFVGIGNVDASCSRRSIMNHLSSKKVHVTLNDIELRSELRSKRLFKVAVPLNKVQQALMNWPPGIETKRWASPQSPSSNSQKFRNNHQNWYQSKFKSSRNWSHRQSSY